jgi:hypothetical protein
MPLLTQMPQGRSAVACHDWAADQDSDALDMWGQQASGQSSESVALSRLSNYCVAGDIPELAEFGSSYGFDRDFCARHRGMTICHQH